MGARIKPDDLAAKIRDTLSAWSDDLTEGIAQDIVDVANETAEELRATSPTRTGAYGRDWGVKKVNDSGHTTATVYNRKHYRLTHLLEFPHATRSGGRTRAVVHIATAEADAIDKLTEKIEKRVGK